MEKDSFFKLFLWDRDLKVVNVNSWMNFEDSVLACTLFVRHSVDEGFI